MNISFWEDFGPGNQTKSYEIVKIAENFRNVAIHLKMILNFYKHLIFKRMQIYNFRQNFSIYGN